MFDGRFDPAFGELFVSDEPQDTNLISAVYPALMAYGATLVMLGCLWLMSLP